MKRAAGAPCTLKPAIERRRLIDAQRAADLEDAFGVLANGTRLRMLHALVREPDLCVGELSEAVGMKMQAVSNQLRRLVAKGIVASRRNKTQVHYRIVDPCVMRLLDHGLCLVEDLRGGARRPARRRRGAGER